MANQIAVLIIEDEELIRMDIADYLQREGFMVYEAADAAQAIDLLESIPLSQSFSPMSTCPEQWTASSSPRRCATGGRP